MLGTSSISDEAYCAVIRVFVSCQVPKHATPDCAKRIKLTHNARLVEVAPKEPQVRLRDTAVEYSQPDDGCPGLVDVEIQTVRLF